MTKVLFTRTSNSDSGITVTLTRLVEANLLSHRVYETVTKGSTIKLYLEDGRGNRQRVTFMVNRVSSTGAATLRSITSVSLLSNQPKVGKPTLYRASTK